MKNKNKQRIGDLKSILDLQSQDGNWNFDPYMHGMANGLILAYHIMTASPMAVCPYKEAPKKWLCDLKLKKPAVAKRGRA